MSFIGNTEMWVRREIQSALLIVIRSTTIISNRAGG
jgi:hypothetical protein